MDQLQQRTLWIGFVIGLALYALGYVAPFLIREPVGQYVALALTGASLVFMVAWLVAVLRGFRLGKETRQGRRHKDREKSKPVRRF